MSTVGGSEQQKPTRREIRRSGATHEKLRNSALEGYLDYIDIAERVGQGVTVEEEEEEDEGPDEEPKR